MLVDPRSLLLAASLSPVRFSLSEAQRR